MRQDESILRVVLEALLDGVAAVDPQGRALFVNNAMARLLSLKDAQSLPELTLREMFARLEAYTDDGAALPFDQRPLVRALRGESVIDVALTIKQPLQSRSFEVINSAFPIFAADGSVRMAVIRMRDVTEQRRTLRELKRSEDRYQLAMRAIDAMLYDWDVATGHVDRSDALERLLGFRPEETEPTVTWWRNRIHPDDVSASGSQVEEQLAARLERLLAEYRIRHKDGRWITVVDRGIVIYDADGAPTRVVGSTVDVTSARQAGQALRESEARFAKAFQLVPVAVALSTLEDGRYLDVNATLLALSGYRREEVIGQTERELGMYADERDHDRLREALAADGSVNSMEIQLRDKWGVLRTSLLSADLIELSGQQCLLSATVDITERKFAETALAESEQRYRALFENASDIVATLDLNFRITSINAAVERILGYKPEDVVGTQLAEYVAANQEARSSAGTYEVDIRAKDGVHVIALEVRASVLRDGRGMPMALHAIARDVTERKHAEARQLILMRELQHRTKNILAVVQSLVTNTLRSAGNLHQAHDSLVGRLHAVAAAQEFVTSEGGGGAPLATLVEGELAAFAGRVRVSGPPLIVGHAFAQTFTLVVHELATNAAKYGALSTPEGHVVAHWDVVAGENGPEFQFSWMEKGGPRVSAPRSAGFGRRIINLLGQPTLQFLPEGLRYQLSVPMMDLAP